MKFRIKFVCGIGFFAQVKHGIFSPWKKIGEHVSGYGLYPSDCMERPMETKHDALERAKLYEQWFANTMNLATYIDI